MPSVFDVARVRPDGVALAAGSLELTYQELASRVRALDERFGREALEPEVPVGFVARPSVDAVVLLWALAERRVPLLLIHPRTPAGERERLLARAGARLWFAPDEDARARAVPSASSPRAVFPGAFAIAPSSGSTGAPKLVILGRAAVAASARASVQHFALTEDDRWLLCLPLAHVGGLAIVVRSLLARSRIVLHDAGARGLLREIDGLSRALHEHAVTLLSVVPAVLDALLASSERPPSSLRATLVGGAAASPALLERARARGYQPLTTYGLTEAGSHVTVMPLGEAPRVEAGVASAGRALPGVELAIDGEERVRVRAESLCSGYVDSPFSLDDDGFLRTEDRGRLDADGYLYVLGRASELIITGGENVDPLRVEAVLAELPSVEGALVFGVPDERFGERVACALVVRGVFDRAAFDAALPRALARHEWPREIALLPGFELLSNGKVDRAATRRAALAELGCGDVRARNPAEPSGS